MLDDALDLPRDDNGRITGYLVGKSARLADWQHKKEKESFEALCARLRARRWGIQAKTDPHKKALKKATQRRYNAKPENAAKNYARCKKRRAAAYRSSAPVFTCVECGATWCKAPWTKGPKPRFCGDRCRSRARYQERTPGARRCQRSGG